MNTKMCLHRNPNHTQIPSGLRRIGSVWFTDNERASYRMGDMSAEQLRFLANLEEQFRNETSPASGSTSTFKSASTAAADSKG